MKTKVPKPQLKRQPTKTVQALAESDSVDYALEKLGVAVWTLATGSDRIKARLADAFIGLAVLQESDFPPALRSRWRRIRSDLTSGKMQYDLVVRNGELAKVPAGLLYSTLRFMRLAKAQRLAREICELESMLNSYAEENRDD